MLKTGRAVRNLGKRDMFRLLRWGPMAVADLVSEYFETELLRAVIASRGIFGTFLGPWSAGSALVLLIRAAGDPHPAGSALFRRRRHWRRHSGDGGSCDSSGRGDPHRSGSH